LGEISFYFEILKDLEESKKDGSTSTSTSVGRSTINSSLGGYY